MAADMTNVHNALIRGLNAIYLQCEHIRKPKDILDFAAYIKAWSDTIHHHHHIEETVVFPGLEEIAQEAGGTANLDGNVEQHHAFTPGLERLSELGKDVLEGKKKYDAREVKTLIDEFASILVEHLHDGIKTLLALEKFDGPTLKKAFDKMVEKASKSADPVSVFISSIFSCR